MAVRPDGGWGWIIAIASFVVNVIVDGVKYSFGIMFVELLDTFQGSKSDTSWIMSIQMGIMFISGPILAALVNKFGAKTVALAGTVLSFAGFLASAFAKSLYILYVTFGLLGGFGFGMLTLPVVVMLPHYFDKRLAFASGIAAMGSGVGTLVFNPLSKILIDKYTWRGTFIINAGIILNCVACALVLRLPDNSTATLREEELDANLKQNESFEKHIETSHEFLADTTEVPRLRDEPEIDSEEENGNIEMDFTYNTEQVKFTSDMCKKISLNTKSSDSTAEDITDLYTDKIDEEEALSASVNASDNINSHPRNKREEKRRRWFSAVALKNPAFLLFLLSEALIQLSLNTPFTFLPEMMLYKGFRRQDAVWMLFIIGLVSTIIRITIGFVADLKFVNRLKLCNSIIVLNGVIVILCPFCSNYASFVAFSVFFGFSAGSSSSLRSVLIPDLFGIEIIADLNGIAMFFGGIAALIGLPKAGALYDATGNYVIPFVEAGAELALSGILLFLVLSVQRCSA